MSVVVFTLKNKRLAVIYIVSQKKHASFGKL